MSESITLVYLFRGKILIPILARTEADFLIGYGPVEVLNSLRLESLQDALKRVAAAGNPLVPNPPGGRAFPQDPVLQHAGVKRWAAFEKDAQLWSIKWTGNVCEIVPQ